MKVAIIMGSIHDQKIADGAAEVLEKFGVDYEMKVISAHRTPVDASNFATHAETEGYDVIIAIAGKAAHLAGVLASYTIVPVIGVPVSSSVAGLDSLLATVQMPTGVPVATVAIDGGKNAGVLAVEILALNNSNLADKLRYYKSELARDVEAMNKELANK